MMVYRPRNRAATHRVYRKRLMDYFLPLFLFISFAVIVILGIQLYQAIFNKNEPLDAFLFTLQGRSQVLPVGAAQYEQALDQTRVFRGDEIHTEPGGRMGIEFFKRIAVRLEEKTTAALTNFSTDRNTDTIGFTMKGGRVWVNAERLDGKDLDFTLVTPQVRIENTGGVFDILDESHDNGGATVRVAKGSVTLTVVVTDASTSRDVETFKISEGQEFAMDASAYQAFQKYQSPEVVGPIDEAFASDAWYLWNATRDEVK